MTCQQLALAFQALNRFDGCALGSQSACRVSLTLTDKSCWEDRRWDLNFLQQSRFLTRVFSIVALKSLCFYRTVLYCTGHVVRRGGRVLSLVFVLCPDFCGIHKCIFCGLQGLFLKAWSGFI